jgi:hypothetical protein
MSGNAAWLVRRQPLPGRAMLLAILISDNRSRRGRTRSGWSENWCALALGAKRNEAVHLFRIRQDQIDRRCRKILVLGGKLIKKTLVAWVNGTQEEHGLENLRDRDR